MKEQVLIFGNTFVECRKCHRAYNLIGNIEEVNKKDGKIIYAMKCSHCGHKDKIQINKG